MCHNCKRRGHYSAQCFSKSIADVTVPSENTDAEDSDTESDDVVYLDTFGLEQGNNAGTSMIFVDGQEVCFKLDPGAGVTAISEDALRSIDKEGNQAQAVRAGQESFKCPWQVVHNPILQGRIIYSTSVRSQKSQPKSWPPSNQGTKSTRPGG